MQAGELVRIRKQYTTQLRDDLAELQAQARQALQAAAAEILAEFRGDARQLIADYVDAMRSEMSDADEGEDVA